VIALIADDDALVIDRHAAGKDELAAAAAVTANHLAGAAVGGKDAHGVAAAVDYIDGSVFGRGDRVGHLERARLAETVEISGSVDRIDLDVVAAGVADIKEIAGDRDAERTIEAGDGERRRRPPTTDDLVAVDVGDPDHAVRADGQARRISQRQRRAEVSDDRRLVGARGRRAAGRAGRSHATAAREKGRQRDPEKEP